jgi:transposase
VRERAAQQAHRARRSALYQQVRTWHAHGGKKRQIAKRPSSSRRTVRTFVGVEAYPERAPRMPTPGSLAPYAPYLWARWEAGCQNGLQMWQERQAQGFPGSRKPVARGVQQRRVSPTPTPPRQYLHQRQAEPTKASATASPALARPAVPAPRQLVWLRLREYTRLHAEERAVRARLRQDRAVEIAYALAQRCRTLVHDRVPAVLAPWLSAYAADGIPDLQPFAAGRQPDYPAVEAALRETWSTGPLEGQVHRLQLITRQMYGRPPWIASGNASGMRLNRDHGSCGRTQSRGAVHRVVQMFVS